MPESFLVTLFHGLHKKFFPLLVHQTGVESLVEALRGKDMLVEGLEDDAIDKDRLENLGDVERQRVATLFSQIFYAV